MKSQFDDTSHSFHGSMITATNGSRFYAFEIEWSTPMAEDLETKLSSSIEPWVKAWNQNYHQDNGDWTGENGGLEGNNGFLPTKMGLQLAKLSVWWISNGGLMGLTNKKCDLWGFSFGYQTKFGHLADHADRIETHLSEQLRKAEELEELIRSCKVSPQLVEQVVLIYLKTNNMWWL